jgi:hypothetical protein
LEVEVVRERRVMCTIVVSVGDMLNIM